MVEIKFIPWPTQNEWQLNVDIFPSPSDVGNSSGLCGVLDGNYRNDFTRNDAKKRWTTQIIIIITIHQTHFLNHAGSLNMTLSLKYMNIEVLLFKQH